MTLPKLNPPASLEAFCKANHDHSVDLKYAVTPRFFPYCLKEDAIRATNNKSLVVDFLDHESLTYAIKKERERSKNLSKKRKKFSIEYRLEKEKRKQVWTQDEIVLHEFCVTYHVPLCPGIPDCLLSLQPNGEPMKALVRILKALGIYESYIQYLHYIQPGSTNRKSYHTTTFPQVTRPTSVSLGSSAIHPSTSTVTETVTKPLSRLPPTARTIVPAGVNWSKFFPHLHNICNNRHLKPCLKFPACLESEIQIAKSKSDEVSFDRNAYADWERWEGQAAAFDIERQRVYRDRNLRIKEKEKIDRESNQEIFPESVKRFCKIVHGFWCVGLPDCMDLKKATIKEIDAATKLRSNLEVSKQDIDILRTSTETIHLNFINDERMVDVDQIIEVDELESNDQTSQTSQKLSDPTPSLNMHLSEESGKIKDLISGENDETSSVSFNPTKVEDTLDHRSRQLKCTKDRIQASDTATTSHPMTKVEQSLETFKEKFTILDSEGKVKESSPLPIPLSQGSITRTQYDNINKLRTLLGSSSMTNVNNMKSAPQYPSGSSNHTTQGSSACHATPTTTQSQPFSIKNMFLIPSYTISGDSSIITALDPHGRKKVISSRRSIKELTDTLTMAHRLGEQVLKTREKLSDKFIFENIELTPSDDVDISGIWEILEPVKNVKGEYENLVILGHSSL